MHKGLSLDKQKSIAWAALKNYALALDKARDLEGLQELCFMLKGFSDAWINSKKLYKETV